jgi:hypothetical protein
VNRLKEEKAVKAEVQKWRSEGRKEIIASEQAALKQYEKQLIEEARIKSEQYRSVRLSFWDFCLHSSVHFFHWLFLRTTFRTWNFFCA